MHSKYILLISWIISVGLSALFSVFSIWGYNQAEVSAMLSTSFTPAGYTFAIWSVIYATWILLWVLVPLWFIKIEKNSIYLLATAQILSSLWLLPSQSLYIGTSFIVMLCILYILLLCFFVSRNENKYFRYTCELFLAWIIVASIANFHLMLVSYELYFFPVVFTLTSIIFAISIFLTSTIKYKTFIPSLVFIWSAFWIIVWQENIYTILCSLWWILIVTWALFYSFWDYFYSFLRLKK